MSSRSKQKKTPKKRKLQVELDIDEHENELKEQPKRQEIVFEHDVLEKSDSDDVDDEKENVIPCDRDGCDLQSVVEWLDAGERHDDWEEEVEGVVHGAVMHKSVWYKSCVINVGDFVEVYSDTGKLWWCYVMELYELVPKPLIKTLEENTESASLWAGSSKLEWNQYVDDDSADRPSRLASGGKGMMYVMWCMTKEEVVLLDEYTAWDMSRKYLALNITEKEMHPQPIGCVERKLSVAEVLSKVKYTFVSGVNAQKDPFYELQQCADVISFMKSKVSVWNGSDDEYKQEQQMNVALTEKATQSPLVLLRDLAIANPDFVLDTAYYRLVVEPHENSTLLSFGHAAAAKETKAFVNKHWRSITLSPMPRDMSIVFTNQDGLLAPSCFLCKQRRALRYNLHTGSNDDSAKCLGSDCYVRLFTLLEVRNSLLEFAQNTQKSKTLPTQEQLKSMHSRVLTLVKSV